MWHFHRCRLYQRVQDVAVRCWMALDQQGMEWEAASTMGKAELNLTPSRRLSSCVILNFLELWGAHASDRDENPTSPWTYISHLATSLAQRRCLQLGLHRFKCFSFSTSCEYFWGGGCPPPRSGHWQLLRTPLTGIDERVSLTSVYFPPAWFQSLHREHFPQGPCCLKMHHSPLGESRDVAINSFIFKARSRSSSFLRQSLEVQAPASRAVGQDDLERSLLNRGSEMPVLLSSQSPGGNVD